MSKPIQLYTLARNSACRMAVLIDDIFESCQTPTSLGDCGDAILAMKRAANELEESAKNLRAKHKILERLLCQACSVLHLEEAVLGEFSSSLPKVRMASEMPDRKKDPEKYVELMSVFGVNREAALSGLIVPHWPHMQDYLARLELEGQRPPAGVSGRKTFPLFSVDSRLRAGVSSLDSVPCNNGENENGEDGNFEDAPF